MLKVSGLNVSYGDVQVLWDINLEIRPGESVALVGSNGAGKTTLLKTIAGLLHPRSGRIQFGDMDITALKPGVRVHQGLALVPEGRQLFYGLSVRENLLMGAYTRKDRAQVMRDLEWVLELFPELRDRQNQLAGTLSGGEQQMCAIGRGLMSKPKMLLIDELSLGLAPVIVDRLVRTMHDIHAAGVTLFLVEQDIQTAFDIAERGYVLETGHIVRQGTGNELLADDQVRQAYLGI